MFQPEKIKKLNNLELEVYHYVKQHPEKIKTMKIRELADNVHVSTATILRFCKKLNYQGFNEFKWTLDLYLQQEKERKDVTQNEISAISNFISSAQQKDFLKQIEALSIYLDSFDTVFFFGLANNLHLAQYGMRYFSDIGKPASLILDPYQEMPPVQYKKAVLLALSVSGDNEGVLQQIHIFKKYKAGTSVITTNPLSSAAKLSDSTLIYDFPQKIITAGSESNILTISSRLPLVLIIEMIGQKIEEYLFLAKKFL